MFGKETTGSETASGGGLVVGINEGFKFIGIEWHDLISKAGDPFYKVTFKFGKGEFDAEKAKYPIEMKLDRLLIKPSPNPKKSAEEDVIYQMKNFNALIKSIFTNYISEEDYYKALAPLSSTGVEAYIAFSEEELVAYWKKYFAIVSKLYNPKWATIPGSLILMKGQSGYFQVPKSILVTKRIFSIDLEKKPLEVSAIVKESEKYYSGSSSNEVVSPKREESLDNLI